MNIANATRGSRLRVLLVAVAVATVVTGGAFGVTDELSGPVATPLGRCSKATALEVANRFGVVTDSTLPNPIAKVLCGPFTGLGSEAMVVSFAQGTCWPNSGWAVFRFAGGSWRLVPERHAGPVVALAASGSDIRETVPVWRSADGRCFPTGGTKTRTWRWNGSRLVASPWRQVTPADTLKSGSFKTPSANIVCGYFIHVGSRASESNLGCVIKSGLRPAPPRQPCQDGGYAGDRVFLRVTGRVQVPSCAGDPGPYVYVDTAKVLGYGKSWSGGGFRCTSTTTGLTCRSKSGHGFFLSREKWQSF